MAVKMDARVFILVLVLLFCGNIETCTYRNEIASFCKQSGLKIVHQNVRGLNANFQLLYELVCNNKFDVVTLSETHLSKFDNKELFEIPGYTFVTRNREEGHGGGVAIYLKDSIKWERRFDLENSVESICLQISETCAKSFLITTLHRPPSSSNYLADNFNDLFNEILTAINSTSMESIILGDANVNYAKKLDNVDFKTSLTRNGYKQTITEPTRITKESSSIIDIIATTRPEVIKETKVFATSISDHEMVGCIRKRNHMRYAAKTIHVRDYSKYNPDEMNNELKIKNWNGVYGSVNVNRALKCFNETLDETFTKHAPFINKRVKGRSCPWLDNDTKSALNDRDKALRKARRTKATEDWNVYKRLRNGCNNLLRYAKSNFNKKLLDENSKNPTKFWKIIKNIFPTKLTPNSASSKSDDSSRANIFSKHYFNVIRTLKTKFIHCRDFVWYPPKNILPRSLKSFKFNPVSEIYILKLLKKLRRNKAAGLDNLPPNMLKDCAVYIYKPLTYIINLSLKTCAVPEMWKKAKVSPIFKAGNASDPENFRPISILPVLSKILERTVHAQLMSYLESNKLLSEFQFGFRPNRSTEIASALFIDDIRREVDSGKLVGSVFLDLSRAFDTISHSQLLTKLPSYGIRDAELEWFTDYLFLRTQRVVLNGKQSNDQPVFNGVPQGSILGPLLFIVFFDDIVTCIEHAKIIMYADDVVIYFADKHVIKIEEYLNEEFERIYEYLQANELIINLKKDKTESLLFGTTKRLNNVGKSFEVRINTDIINNVCEYKYLGNLVDQSLTLRDDFDGKYRKVSGIVHLLKKL